MDQLERAIRDRSRVAVSRRGTEFLVIALRLSSVRQRDAFVGRHPMTGEEMTFVLEDLDSFQVVI